MAERIRSFRRHGHRSGSRRQRQRDRDIAVRIGGGENARARDGPGARTVCERGPTRSARRIHTEEYAGAGRSPAGVSR